MTGTVAWRAPKGGPYTPSPLFYRGRLYVLADNGVFTSYDAETGEIVEQLRVPETGAEYSASPVASDGKVYFTSEDGEVHVVKAGPTYELLASNDMREICMATPAISDGRLFIRTVGHLYAIRADPGERRSVR